jgi:hypothetical protein
MTSRQGVAGMPTAAARSLRGLEFYETPYEALPPLLCAEGRRLPKLLAEPACGKGAIVLPLRARGYEVIASDIIDRGCPDSSVENFLDQRSCRALGIITNPPFDGTAGGIEDFAEHAVRLANYVALFARLALSRIVKIADRLPMIHREGYDGPRQASNGQCYGWFIFEPQRPRRAFTPVYSRLWKRDVQRWPALPADQRGVAPC